MSNTRTITGTYRLRPNKYTRSVSPFLQKNYTTEKEKLGEELSDLHGDATTAG